MPGTGYFPAILQALLTLDLQSCMPGTAQYMATITKERIAMAARSSRVATTSQ